jgi:hypothetical protein
MIAIGAIVPPLLWYTHARGIWATYGNSLGLSNESHWIGAPLFRTPAVFWRVITSDVRSVWTPYGLALGVVGLLLVGARARARDLELAWFTGAAVFLFAAARTTGDRWATHYHVVMVPPAGLLLGSALDAVLQRGRTLARRSLSVGLIGATALLAATLLGSSGVRVLRTIHPTESDGYYRSAQKLRSLVPPGELLVASGGICADEWGGQVAFNAPYFFYWLHCKGWNVCRDSVTVEHLETLATRGARHFVAEKSQLKRTDVAERTLGRRFPILWEDSHVVLFRLTPDVELSRTRGRPEANGASG